MWLVCKVIVAMRHCIRTAVYKVWGGTIVTRHAICPVICYGRCADNCYLFCTCTHNIVWDWKLQSVIVVENCTWYMYERWPLLYGEVCAKTYLEHQCHTCWMRSENCHITRKITPLVALYERYLSFGMWQVGEVMTVVCVQSKYRGLRNGWNSWSCNTVWCPLFGHSSFCVW